MSYVYKKTEPQLWTVGFYSADGKWHSDSDFDSMEDAADRVHYLNGKQLKEKIIDLELIKTLKTIEHNLNHRQFDCYSNDYLGECICGKDRLSALIKKIENRNNG